MKVGIITVNPPELQRRFMEAAPPDMETAVVSDSTSDEEKIAACRDADAIILVSPSVSVEVLRHCPRVKLLQGTRAGYENLDLKAINALGIAFANNGGSNAIPVAEHSVALMLALCRGIVRQVRNIQENRWNEGLREFPTWELSGKRVGIVGLGPIGRATARIVTGLGCEAVYYKTSPALRDVEEALQARFMALDELLSTSDVVTLHVALNESTRGLIGARELSLMKPTAILINTSRGAVIDESALVEALSNSRLAGAGLDVLQEEPVDEGNPLLKLSNVIVTPHQSGISREYSPRSAAFAFANVRRALLGEPVQSLIQSPL